MTSIESIPVGYNSLYKNYGFLLEKTPNNVLSELQIQVNDLKNNFNTATPAGHKLAGEIKHEYELPVLPQLKNYIKKQVEKIESKTNYMGVFFAPNTKLYFNDLWINFQKKYEYNPIHNHSGVWSFVIWYQIPYSIQDEINYSQKSKLPPKPGNGVGNGLFVFSFPELTSPKTMENKSIFLPMDKSKEGYMAIFPSTLEHSVYPFYTSDDYRITIAGNIHANI